MVARAVGRDLAAAGRNGRGAQRIERDIERTDFGETAAERRRLRVARLCHADERRPGQIQHAAVRERAAEAECRTQLPVEADEPFVRDRRLLVGGDAVHGDPRVLRIETAVTLQPLVDQNLAQLGDAVAVAVHGVVVRVRVLNRRDERRLGSGQLRREHRVTAPDDRLPLIADRKGEAGAGRQAVPDVNAVDRGCAQGGEDRLEAGHTRHRRGRERRLLMIETDAAVDRQAIERDGVGDVAVDVLRVSRRPVIASDLHQHVRVLVPGGDQVAGGPDLLRVDRRLAPPGAELHFVPAREVARVAADVMLRARALVLIVGVVNNAAVVDVVVPVQTAGRHELKPRVHIGDLRRCSQVRAAHEGSFAFVVLGPPRLVPGRLRGARRAGVPAVLGFVVVVIGEVAADGVVQLSVRLERAILELRAVGRAREGQKVDGGPGHCPPDPHPVLQERTAQIESVIFVLVGAITFAGRIAKRRRQLGRNIDALQLLVLEVQARAAVRRVDARLQHHAELHAGRRILCVGAAGGDGHLLKAVEVVVERRGAVGVIRPDDAVAHVGDRHAVEAPGVVGRLSAFRVVVRLLPRFRAANVDAVHVDGRHRLHHDPGIPREREVPELLERHVGGRRLALEIDRRRDRNHVDGFGGAGDRQLDRERRAGAAEHLDVAAGGRSETRERGVDGVGADGQVQEVCLPVFVGDLRLRDRAVELHVDPGQPSAGRALDRDVDAAGRDLGPHRRDPREGGHARRRGGHCPDPMVHVQRSSKVDRRPS